MVFCRDENKKNSKRFTHNHINLSLGMVTYTKSIKNIFFDV